MDVATLLIWLVLVLALIGGWLIVGFMKYRHYFNVVNGILLRTKFGSIMNLPTDEMLRFDDVVKRCYFARKPPADAVTAVIDEATRSGR